jgi:hypothetical protein
MFQVSSFILMRSMGSKRDVLREGVYIEGHVAEV